MQKGIVKYTYQNQVIEFDTSDPKLMVNATEMARIFGKDVFQFTRLDGTKSFMASCLKPQFCGLLGIKEEKDLIVSSQKSGTWMHRVLALKYAASLDSDFEVWVYLTIDRILRGRGPIKEVITEELKAVQANIESEEERIRQAQERIRARNEVDVDHQIIDDATIKLTTYKRRASQIRKEAVNQLNLFVQQSADDQSNSEL